MLFRSKSLFAADVWLMCDGPVHQTRRPLIAFGARTVLRVDITTYGPSHELHSGHYGNWAPNPAMLLARLLTSMKEDNGRVRIEHFYDDVAPLSKTEQRALAEAPDIDAELMREFELGSTESSPKKRRFSRAVISSYKAKSWGTSPSRRRSSNRSAGRNSAPLNRSAPFQSESKPLTQASVVDFPAPLGPTKPCSDPAGTRNDAFRTAHRDPNAWLRLSTSIADD